MLFYDRADFLDRRGHLGANCFSFWANNLFSFLESFLELIEHGGLGSVQRRGDEGGLIRGEIFFVGEISCLLKGELLLLYILYRLLSLLLLQLQ